MNTNILTLDEMNSEQEQAFWNDFEHKIINDTGEAAKRHLAAGRAIYYSDDAYPGKAIKEFPDGCRQVISFNDTGNEIIEKKL